MMGMMGWTGATLHSLLTAATLKLLMASVFS
jgi:hypothetical protein